MAATSKHPTLYKKKMKNVSIRKLTRSFAIGISLLVASAVHADVIIEHLGSTDPTTEGWGTLGTGTEMGYPDNINSAWTLDDDSTTASRAYYYAPTLQEQTDVNTFGWNLSVTLQVTDVDNAPDYTRYVDYVDNINGVRWGLNFGSDASGNVIVSLRDNDWELNLGDSGVHTYSLVYDPAAETASLYIDGSTTAALSGYTGGDDAPVTNSTVRWGSSANVPVGSADYYSVTFSQIPEPAESGLLLGMLLLGLCYRLKRGVSKHRS